MSGANASPTGRSDKEMSGANASPIGRSDKEMSGANASPIGRSDKEMSGANASPIGRSDKEMSGANASPIGIHNKMTGYRNIKETPREEFIAAGTTACGGCGGLEVIRLASKVLGDRVVIVNAAGCFSLLALYPFTPFRGSWLYTTMGSAPAGAQGIRDALDILQTKGKLSIADDLQVVVLAGDGSTYDIALSATSGTLFRNLDYWYICYDNEAYGNTGMQQSSSTPLAAQTATTAAGVMPQDAPIGRKDIFEIWRAHRPPYVATVSAAYPLDLMRKFEEAKQFKGPKMFLASSPCPTGWRFDPARTPHYSRLEVDCGLFPLKKAIHGDVTHTVKRSRWRPVEEYLRQQGRFNHLFEPVKQDAVIRTIQTAVDDYWKRVLDLQPDKI